MGSGLSQLAGNPQRMTLGGEVVYLSPLTLSDHAEMMDWVQYYPLAEARREIDEAGDLYDEEDRRRAISKARDMLEDIREVRTGSQQDEDIVDRVATYMDRVLNSYRGTQYFLYLSIKKTKPDFQLGDVDRLITPDNHEAIQERMDDVNLGEVRPMTGKKKPAHVLPLASGNGLGPSFPESCGCFSMDPGAMRTTDCASIAWAF